MNELPRPVPVPGRAEPTASGAEATPAKTAGAMLREARERQGLHIAVLAATIKVAPRKLEALEQDRYDELSNASFVRALAQSVCRSLKIDPRPVLAQLPLPDAASLERTVGTLNAPFRDRPGRSDGAMHTGASRPVLWAGGMLLAGAAAVYFLPPQWWESATRLPQRAGAVLSPSPASAVAAAASTAVPTMVEASAPVEGTWPPPAPRPDLAVVAAPAPAPVLQGTAPASAALSLPALAASRSAPVVAVASAPAPAPASASAAGRVQLKANASSWVEVMDSDGKTVLSRTLQAGEALDVDGAFPLRLKIGNAAGLQVALRGRAVDLSSYTRDNVARLELR